METDQRAVREEAGDYEVGHMQNAADEKLAQQVVRVERDERLPKKKSQMTKAERLLALRERLAAGRDENVHAVEEEARRKPTTESEEKDLPEDKREANGKRDRGQRRYRVDEADGEDEDDELRAMKRRARAVHIDAISEAKATESTETVKVVQYGGAGTVEREGMDRMVNELQEVQKRRERLWRRRTFDEENADVTFINEGNRMFNRTLERHYGRHESVKKIKDDLERGTA